MEIRLNKAGYEPFLDFLKGICIIWVILTHCMSTDLQDCILFSLWGAMAVPVFLLIQVFHSYKRGLGNCKFNVNTWKKIYHRVLKLFVIAQIPLFLAWVYTNKSDVTTAVTKYILGGGIGPGSYYPWIYLQFAFLLPIVAILIRYGGGQNSCNIYHNIRYF